MASTKNIVLQNKLAQLIFETIKAGFYFFYFVGGGMKARHWGATIELLGNNYIDMHLIVSFRCLVISVGSDQSSPTVLTSSTLYSIPLTSMSAS